MFIQGIAIVVGIASVTRVVVLYKPASVIRPAAVHEDPEISEVDLIIVAMAVDVDAVEY